MPYKKKRNEIHGDYVKLAETKNRAAAENVNNATKATRAPI